MHRDFMRDELWMVKDNPSTRISAWKRILVVKPYPDPLRSQFFCSPADEIKPVAAPVRQQQSVARMQADRSNLRLAEFLDLPIYRAIVAVVIQAPEIG